MDEHAEELQEWFEQRRPLFLGWLGSIMDSRIRQRLDPADVLQEAFLRARPKYRHSRAELARDERRRFVWLCRQVRDAYSDLLRHHTQQCRDVTKRQEPLLSRQAGAPDAPAVPVRGLIDSSTPSRKAQRNEFWERYDWVMRQLGPEERESLYLKLWTDLPASDIAQVLQISVDCYYQRVCRAKNRFRDLFGPLGD